MTYRLTVPAGAGLAMMFSLSAGGAEAATACLELTSATFDKVSVTSATIVAAGDKTPAHCEVMAEVPPTDPKGWPIKMRLVLPEDWSGDAMQFGGGGFNGVIPPQVGGRWQTAAAAAAFPFKKHATYSGDSGHDAANLPHGKEEDPRRASFALNQEAFERYARASVNQTYRAAQQIIAAHYGKAPEHNYFVGFSQGGKEAMIAAQDHPEDYDGILVGDPVANLTGLKLAHLQSSGGLYRDGGLGWVSAELAALVTKEVYAQCDPKDGLEDGWIADFEGCQPDLSKLLCAGDDNKECLSEAQLEAVNNIARPVKLDYEIANGLTGHAGYPWGNVAWHGSFAGSRPVPSTPAPSQGEPDSYVWTLGDGYARFMIRQDAKTSSLDFSPNDPALRERIQTVSKLLDATNPDLKPLFSSGAKMILYAGGTSEVPPAEVAAYWKRMSETVGSDLVSGSARFYIFPSINHGGVGPEGMPNTADLLSVLEAWVKDGKAPGNLVNENADGSVTRPLCQYPEWPRYSGQGDTKLAASFECVKS